MKNHKIGLMYKVITSYVSFLLLKVEWIYYHYYYYDYSRSYFLSEVDKVIFLFIFLILTWGEGILSNRVFPLDGMGKGEAPLFLRGMGERPWPSRICKNVREISFLFFKGKKIFKLEKIRFQDYFMQIFKK